MADLIADFRAIKDEIEKCKNILVEIYLAPETEVYLTAIKKKLEDKE